MTQTTATDTELSARWCETHPALDGDSRTPLEVLQAGVISRAEFLAMTAPAGALASQGAFEAMFSYVPQVDTRRPAVPARYSAAERATWRS